MHPVVVTRVPHCVSASEKGASLPLPLYSLPLPFCLLLLHASRAVHSTIYCVAQLVVMDMPPAPTFFPLSRSYLDMETGLKRSLHYFVGIEWVSLFNVLTAIPPRLQGTSRVLGPFGPQSVPVAVLPNCTIRAMCVCVLVYLLTCKIKTPVGSMEHSRGSPRSRASALAPI